MTSGGARARSGPAPDPMALRRDRPSDAAGWARLPVGRTAPAPDWPLTRPTRRELVLWAVEWARPQAVMWEANGQALEVALYVRSVVAAEHPKAPTSMRTLVKQQQEALGLSLPGLLRNRWIIGEAEAPARPQRVASVSTAKARLEVIRGGA